MLTILWELVPRFFGWPFGYPMECLDPCLFVDVVSGKSVGLYKHRTKATRYLAETRWSYFRVSIDHNNGLFREYAKKYEKVG